MDLIVPGFVDIGNAFCQTGPMLCLDRKFVAILLAIWLPLFSGYALADSLVVQNIKGDCHGAQHVTTSSQHELVLHQHMLHVQPTADMHPPASQHDNQGSTCNNCGVCQIACSGYLAAVTIDVVDAQPSSLSFMIFSAQFQSFTSAPLDPPPLELA
jgi:hypothetical protein